MTLVLAYSDKDILQAIRVMAWIGFLSQKHGNSMLNERILLVASRRAAQRKKHRHLCWLASRIFGEARCFVPETEHEGAWPGPANWMFQQALEHVERHFQDDILFLEPDGTPLCPDWFEQIQAGWLEAQGNGKTFLGARVLIDIPHMTGIAVYGRNWRKVAPSLVNVPDSVPWDLHAAAQALPHCHFTKLIQHVFHRHDPGWVVPSLGILDPKAVIFHQDKSGRLINILDSAFYVNECFRHSLFNYVAVSQEETVMQKFYHAENVTRAITSHGKRFRFDALDIHGGAIPGAYATDSESEQIALADLTSNPTTGVTEITK
jgi:hypothetical protein